MEEVDCGRGKVVKITGIQDKGRTATVLLRCAAPCCAALPHVCTVLLRCTRMHVRPLCAVLLRLCGSFLLSVGQSWESASYLPFPSSTPTSALIVKQHMASPSSLLSAGPPGAQWQQQLACLDSRSVTYLPSVPND